CAAQVLVTLGMVGIDTGGVDDHLDSALFRLVGIPAEGTVKVVEAAVQHAEAHMPGLEVDEGLLAFLVDCIVSGEQRTGHGHQATQRDTGNDLFHACFSFEEFSCRDRRPSIRRRVSSRSMKWCFNAPSACNAASPSTRIAAQ